MEMNTEDYLKKALLDTQEKVRDFMHYSDLVDNEELSNCFKEFALTETRQAEQLQNFIKKM